LRSDQGLSSHTDLHVRARLREQDMQVRSVQPRPPCRTAHSPKGEPVTGWRLALNRAPFLAGDQTFVRHCPGAAAGGGFPQWNSNAPGCNRARSGDPAAPARTQASLAVSGNGEDWYLLNASPDLREQLNATPELHPKTGLRSTPIRGVILTGGDVDAIAGLLTLREREAFTIHATARILGILDANPVFEVLARDCVERRPLTLGTPVELTGG
jgi:hypothetical protein